MDTRKNIFLWVSYDFANSIVSIVFFLYFSQWIVVDQSVADIWYNLSFTITAVLLLLTVPVTGTLLDKHWRRIVGLRYTTVSAGVLLGLCALAAVNNHSFLALVLYAVGLFFYLLSFTFYTPLIKDIANASRQGKVSGYGIFANYIGQITGLLAVLPFAIGKINLFGGMTRAETLLPAVALFMIFSLPMLVWFKEPGKESSTPAYIKEVKHSWKEAKVLFALPGLLPFFAAYFFFNDAVLTVANNFSIFLQQVWSVPDTIKTYIVIGVLITSAIGGLISGVIADRVGHKRTLVWILTGWIFILPAVALIPDFNMFIMAVTLLGLWFGSTWTVSRSVMSYLAPANKHNLTFAYFGLVERASAFIGPIVWGAIATGFVALGPARYRLAATILTIFIVVGLVYLKRIPSDRKD